MTTHEDRKRLKAEGTCTVCHKNYIPPHLKWLCEECADRRRKLANARRKHEQKLDAQAASAPARRPEMEVEPKLPPIPLDALPAVARPCWCPRLDKTRMAETKRWNDEATAHCARAAHLVRSDDPKGALEAVRLADDALEHAELLGRFCDHPECERFHVAKAGEKRGQCAIEIADQGARTLEQVGELLGVCRERVRQIEAPAIRRIKCTRRLEEYRHHAPEKAGEA